MATKTASFNRVEDLNILDRVSLGDSDNTIEGGEVVWALDTAVTGARDLTVRTFDKSRMGEFPNKKPCILIKCGIDCSVNNVTLKNAAGGTLYTFNSDCSVTAIYVALRLTAAGAWELA